MKKKVAVISLISVSLLVALAAFVVFYTPQAEAAGKWALGLLNAVPQGIYELVITSVIGAIAVSPVALAIKKWFTTELNTISEKKMILIVAFGSFLSAAVTYVVASPTFAPWIIAVQGFVTLGMTQPVFFLFVKPLSIRLGAWFTSQVNAAVLKNEARAALIPENGIPAPMPSLTNFK